MAKCILILIVSLCMSFQTAPSQKKLKFEFTVEETQLIYDALGELPAKKVENLRLKILMDSQRQLDTTNKK